MDILLLRPCRRKISGEQSLPLNSGVTRDNRRFGQTYLCAVELHDLHRFDTQLLHLFIPTQSGAVSAPGLLHRHSNARNTTQRGKLIGAEGNLHSFA
jgi:hypothetical protein